MVEMQRGFPSPLAGYSCRACLYIYTNSACFSLAALTVRNPMFRVMKMSISQTPKQYLL